MIKPVAQELGYAPPVTFTTNDHLYCLFQEPAIRLKKVVNDYFATLPLFQKVTMTTCCYDYLVMVCFCNHTYFPCQIPYLETSYPWAIKIFSSPFPILISGTLPHGGRQSVYTNKKKLALFALINSAVMIWVGGLSPHIFEILTHPLLILHYSQ